MAARPRAHWRTGGHTAAHWPAVRGVRERRERAGPRRWAAQQQATARAGRSAVVSQAAGRCLAQTSATCRAPLRQARLRAQQLPAASGASSRAQRACAVGSMVFSRLSHAGAGSRAMQRVISVLQAAPALLCVGDPRPACACWIAHCMRTLLRQCNRDLCRLCEAGSARYKYKILSYILSAAFRRAAVKRRVRMPAYASNLRALEADALDAERCVQGITEEHAHAAAALLTRMERQAFAAPARQSEQLQQLHAMARTASLDRSPNTNRPPLCCALLRSGLPVTPCQFKSRQELLCWCCKIFKNPTRAQLR